jgi:hypothetical protein
MTALRLSLCLSAAGKRETLLQSIGIITFVLALYLIPFCSGTGLHLPPRTTVHASGSAPGCKGGKGPGQVSERGRRSAGGSVCGFHQRE